MNDKKEVKLKGKLPEKAYCYHCTTDKPYTIKTERITSVYKNEKISFVSAIPYCSHCGKESYIYILDLYNQEMLEHIYNNLHIENKSKVYIEF